MFGAYYEKIFQNLNASQMIVAVQVFRFCDANRKKKSQNPEIQVIRSYSNYYISCMIGQKILRKNNISIEQLTHQNFALIREYFDANKEDLLNWAEKHMVAILHEYFGLDWNDSLSKIDGRTMAAAFRRFDIVERYFKDDLWWSIQIDE